MGAGEIVSKVNDQGLYNVRLLRNRSRHNQPYVVPEDPTVEAWCADRTTDLDVGARVGTIEVPGERGDVNIAPGGGDGVGVLQPTQASTPAGVFYNWALLPGLQRYFPTYRYGEISAIDYDANTCTVTLEPATSSAQGLNINDRTTLSGVPIDYMDCNADAFEAGDAVLVAFIGQSWDDPVVIGFKEQPDKCHGCPNCDHYTETAGNMEPSVAVTLEFLPDDPDNQPFKGEGRGCEESLTDWSWLTDRMPTGYVGTFDNPTFYNDTGKWTVDYTPHADVCSASRCPEICGQSFECDCCNCDDLAWDDVTSAETIAQSSSCVIAISDPDGLCGPYSWTVGGPGFTLAAATTTGLTNTLYANGSACGMARITVEGCDGSKVRNSVRCTSGSWSSCGSSSSGCTGTGSPVTTYFNPTCRVTIEYCADGGDTDGLCGSFDPPGHTWNCDICETWGAVISAACDTERIRSIEFENWHC